MGDLKAIGKGMQVVPQQERSGLLERFAALVGGPAFGDSLAAYKSKDHTVRRISPDGFPEYLQGRYEPSPLPQGTLGLTNGFGTVLLANGWEDNPEIVNHERMHVGQFSIPHYPTPEGLNALMRLHPRLTMNRDISELNSYEAPAYEFASPSKWDPQGQGELFSRYIAALRSLGEEQSRAGVARIERAAPRSVLLESLKHPRVPMPIPKELR